MTIKEAEQMIIDAYSNYSLPEENKFQLIEALEFLIEATHNPVHMMHLGGIYYEDRYYDLALKLNIPALVSSESGIWKPRFRRLGNRSSGNWEPVIR